MKAILRRNQKKLLPFELLEKDKRLEVVLAGEGAEVEIVGLVIGKGSDERSLETYITHSAPNTKSKVNVRAVLRGKAKFDFRGNVKIEKGAKGADAYLRSEAERLLIQGFVKPIKNILRASNTSREVSTNVSSRLRSNNKSRPARHR